jgi:hypothetical protein
MVDPGTSLFAEQPDTQEREQFLGVHRFGDIVRSAGLEAFLTIPFHRFGGKSEDR